jgi:uncharacterized membrane protein YdcZ (DUF606 family)
MIMFIFIDLKKIPHAAGLSGRKTRALPIWARWVVWIAGVLGALFLILYAAFQNRLSTWKTQKINGVVAKGSIKLGGERNK